MRTITLVMLGTAGISTAFMADRMSAAAVHNDTPRVTGIGGIFFKSRDPQADLSDLAPGHYRVAFQDDGGRTDRPLEIIR